MLKMTTRKPWNFKGFTLIELLVVISIIALLLSILMPSLNKAKEAARNVVCKSNLKQWGFGFAMYAQAFKDRLPKFYSDGTSGAWYHVNTMGSYLPNDAVKYASGQVVISKGIAVCPSHSAARSSPLGRSYGFNYYLRPPEDLKYDRPYSFDFKADMKRKDRAILGDGCFDKPDWNTGKTRVDMGLVSFYFSNEYDLNYFRHGGKGNQMDNEDRYTGVTNVLFGDWHVDSKKLSDHVLVRNGPKNP